MSKDRRKFTREFKIKVVEAYRSGQTAIELSRQFELHPNVIYEWDKQYPADPEHAFGAQRRTSGPSKVQDDRIAELERMVGRLSLENDFLKKPWPLQREFRPREIPGIQNRDSSPDRTDDEGSLRPEAV